MKLKTALVKLWAVASCCLTFGVIFFLFAYIFAKGAGAITWEFLTESPKGMIIGTEGGILPAIAGSAWYTGIACLFGATLGICTAVYQVYYCRSQRLSNAIALVMQCMAGVPSIVMGLFGYTLLVLTLGWGKCILAGGITQGVMILPFIQVRAEKALREVDQNLVRASYAMGMSRAYTVRRIVLPQCLPQLVSGVILGACYAMGACAPLIFTGAVIIANGRIAAAGCILPLTGKQNISKELGTRHRAGLGQSEAYDSLSVIVSEETGGISLAEGGVLKRHLAPETLERLLTAKLMPEEEETAKPALLDRVKGWIVK